MKGGFDRWLLYAVWALLIGRIISFSYSLITKTASLPQPPEIVHDWTLEEEAEMEWLVNHLDWNNPSVCQNPLVVKYDLCDDSASAYTPWQVLRATPSNKRL